jgi:hypothetical protein
MLLKKFGQEDACGGVFVTYPAIFAPDRQEAGFIGLP